MTGCRCCGPTACRTPPSRSAPQSAVSNLALGGTSGFTAASICYPLDTIRRRMQMAGHMYDGQLDAFRKIWQQVLGFLAARVFCCGVQRAVGTCIRISTDMFMYRRACAGFMGVSLRMR